MLVEDKIRAEVISTSWLCNLEGLSSVNGLSQLADPPGPRFVGFIRYNSAWADPVDLPKPQRLYMMDLGAMVGWKSADGASTKIGIFNY